MKCRISHIGLVMTIPLLVLLLASCERKEDVIDSDTATTLQFQECYIDMYFLTKEEFYEIKVDLDARKFTRPKKLESFKKSKKPTFISEEIQDVVLNALDANSENVSISLVSPDKHWASAVRFEKIVFPEGIVESSTAYYLVDIIESKLVWESSSMGVTHFTNDLNIAIGYDWPYIKRIHLPSQTVTDICRASGYFIMLPERNKLMVFNKHKIWLYDLDGNKKKKVGKYRRVIGIAGLVNKKWAYFFTRRKVKPQIYDKLFFINLSTYDIIRYPYKFHPAEIVRIIPEYRLETSN